MSKRRTKSVHADSDESDTDRGFFGKFMETVILFFICVMLLRIAVMYLVSIRVPLIIIGSVIGIAVISYRIHKWRNRDDY
ncbi:hypothetical protein IJG04_00350 [Candidatus Saccharibacteria bacterium]|nr:hypothetical protein [Candidatus Saccharibacteria bacterium]